MKFQILLSLFLIFYTCSISLGGEIRTSKLSVKDSKEQVTRALTEKTEPKKNTSDIPNDQAYIIGAGDVINLNVWKNTDLSREVTVLPDGTVSFPLIGQVIAGGKSVAELEKEITTRIKLYLSDPVLDVSVMQVNSMLIYVLGKVKKPGKIPIQADINVLQALAMAGGLDEFADEDGIKVIRKEGNKTLSFGFEYDRLIRGQKLEQNIQLQRGDVLIIP